MKNHIAKSAAKGDVFSTLDDNTDEATDEQAHWAEIETLAANLNKETLCAHV